MVLNVKVLIVLLFMSRVTRGGPYRWMCLLPSSSPGWDVNPASCLAPRGFRPQPTGESYVIWLPSRSPHVWRRDNSCCRPGRPGPLGSGGAVVPALLFLTVSNDVVRPSELLVTRTELSLVSGHSGALCFIWVLFGWSIFYK